MGIISPSTAPKITEKVFGVGATSYAQDIIMKKAIGYNHRAMILTLSAGRTQGCFGGLGKERKIGVKSKKIGNSATNNKIKAK